VVGVNSAGVVYTRTGTTPSAMMGTAWVALIGGTYMQASWADMCDIMVATVYGNPLSDSCTTQFLPGRVMWGVDSSNQVWFRSGSQSQQMSPWTQVLEAQNGVEMKDVSVSTGSLQVWGLDPNDQIYYRVGVANTFPTGFSWVLIPGSLSNIAVSPAGNVWGVNAQGLIYNRVGVSPSNFRGTGWVQVDGNLKQISASDSGVWGVTVDGAIYFRNGVSSANPRGSSWTLVSGALVQISVGPNNQVWGVNSGENIYFRNGITDANPQGTDWTQIDGEFIHVNVGPHGEVAAINPRGHVHIRSGVTRDTPMGDDWTKIEIFGNQEDMFFTVTGLLKVEVGAMCSR